MEFFTKTSVRGIWAIYLIAMGLLFYLGISQEFLTSIPISAALFLAGVLTWTLIEYALHRYIFHIVTEHPIGQKILHAAHGFHHDFPTDKDHLFIPPVLGLMI
ncbi:MAG: fatty acid hydroxylase, partial [Bacteroidota bacterium]